MGVLDDAIREHLELKRKRGAEEEELARQEAEALAPARRGPAAEGYGDGEPAEAVDPAAEPGPEEAEPQPGDVVAAEPVRPAAHEPESAATVDPDVPPAEPVHDIDEDPLEPPPPMADAGADPDSLVERSPVRPAPVDGALPEEPPVVEGDAAEGDDDVLEETPEFLRETPEHDRLWFEQKPPRDFDLED